MALVVLSHRNGWTKRGDKVTLRRRVRRFGSRRRVLARLGVLGMALAAVLVNNGMPAASAATTNLVRNGCLDEPSLPLGSGNTESGGGLVKAGSTQIPGWTVGPAGGEVEVFDHTEGSPIPPGCSEYVGLSVVSGSSISQVVSTTPGASYLLQWEFSEWAWPGLEVRSMEVIWEGRVVASRSLTYVNQMAEPVWASEQVVVTATEKSSDLTFKDTTGTVDGATIGSVSLTLATETVNGFAASNSTGVYASAERQMLAKIPGSAVVIASGTRVCTLRAAAAEQVKSGTGFLITWTIAPTSQFVHEPSATRQARAEVVETYLAGLLKRSRNLYLDSLLAARIPMEGSAWWGVEVQSVSTIGSLMSFEIASAGTQTTMTWSSVPGVTSAAPALASEALANLLYYTKNIAVL